MGVVNSANTTERSIDYYTGSTAPVEIKRLLAALHEKTKRLSWAEERI